MEEISSTLKKQGKKYQMQAKEEFFPKKQKGKKVSKETREKLRNAILGKKREPYKKKQE